jgi:hypothetical protein
MGIKIVIFVCLDMLSSENIIICHIIFKYQPKIDNKMNIMYSKTWNIFQKKKNINTLL